MKVKEGEKVRKPGSEKGQTPAPHHSFRSDAGEKRAGSSPSVRISFRTAMLIVLAASFFTFASQVAISVVSYHRYAAEREESLKEFRSKQGALEERIREMEAKRDEEKLSFENRFESLAAADAAVAEGRPIAEDASFPIENVLGSIVELVCLDNSDKDTFYTGSGTVVDQHGVIVTNHHLLVSSDGSLIRFCGVGFTDDMQKPPRTAYIAETVAVQTDTDLAAMLIIEHLDGEALPESFSHIAMEGILPAVRGLQLGDAVYIAGYPGVGAQTFTFTQGVVSGRVGSDLIKTSALVDSGTSGGAAFDMHGNFIGLPTAAARGDIGGSLGYLIAADVVDAFLGDYYAGKLNDSVTGSIE